MNLPSVLTLLAYFIMSSLYGQSLSVEETVDYINKTLDSRESIGMYEQIGVSFDGKITINQYYSKGGKLFTTHEMYFDEVSFGAVTSGQGMSVVVGCISEKGAYNLFQPSCISCSGNCYGNNNASPSTWIKGDDKRQIERLANSFKYLQSIMEQDSRFDSTDYDPFSNDMQDNLISRTNTGTANLRRNGGVFMGEVSINGIVETFVIDSGASDVTINSLLEEKLIQSGKLSKGDYLSPAFYKLADGSVISCRRFKAEKVILGGIAASDVIVSVGNQSSVLLLGKSFLDLFSSWTIDNSTHTLKVK